MNFKHFSGIIITCTTLAVLASCVPNKKVALLQNKNEYKNPGRDGESAHVRTYTAPTVSYLLQPNDLLDIKISTMTPAAFNPFNDADRTLVPGMVYGQSGTLVQSQGYYVDPEGYIEVPIIGSLKVADLTIVQAEDSLAALVKKYLDKPVVRVKLLNFRFSVIGEVENESTLLAGDNNLTLIQALAMAGGASEFGDLSRVKLIRTAGQKTYVYYVNLLSEEFLTSNPCYVQPNDVIVIMPLKQRAYLKYLSPNVSLLATSVSLLIGIVTLLKIW